MPDVLDAGQRQPALHEGGLSYLSPLVRSRAVVGPVLARAADRPLDPCAESRVHLLEPLRGERGGTSRAILLATRFMRSTAAAYFSSNTTRYTLYTIYRRSG